MSETRSKVLHLALGAGGDELRPYVIKRCGRQVGDELRPYVIKRCGRQVGDELRPYVHNNRWR